MADIIVAKHRHGPTNRVQLYFREKLTRFENLASARVIQT
ncbi:MAG: DnaB-like helicase C-terminal domain-containing protein [Chloroflexota bacterium]